MLDVTHRSGDRWGTLLRRVVANNHQALVLCYFMSKLISAFKNRVVRVAFIVHTRLLQEAFILPAHACCVQYCV